MNKDETLRLALKALKETWYHVGTFAPTNEAIELYDKAITALRLAIDVENMASESTYKEQLETKDEPFEYWNAVEGWVKIDEVREHFESASCGTIYKNGGEGRVPLYTTPQRTWVGLTDEEIETIYAECNVWDKFEYERMLEAKLKEKNNAI